MSREFFKLYRDILRGARFKRSGYGVVFVDLCFEDHFITNIPAGLWFGEKTFKILNKYLIDKEN